MLTVSIHEDSIFKYTSRPSCRPPLVTRGGNPSARHHQCPFGHPAAGPRRACNGPRSQRREGSSGHCVWRRSDAGAGPWAGGGGTLLVRSCGRHTHGASGGGGRAVGKDGNFTHRYGYSWVPLSAWEGYGHTLIPMDSTHTLPVKLWVGHGYSLLSMGIPISYPFILTCQSRVSQ
jgi:hypothetical protein